MTRVLLLAALALACVASPALAAEVAPVRETAVILPYGQWITAIAQTAAEMLIPVIVAVSAAAAALLVPLTGFLKTFFDYRIEAQKAEALKPAFARDVAQGAGGVLCDSMAVADLTSAIEGLTLAIRADTASEEAEHASQFAQVLQRLTDVLNHHDDTHRHPPRGGRRCPPASPLLDYEGSARGGKRRFIGLLLNRRIPPQPDFLFWLSQGPLLAQEIAFALSGGAAATLLRTASSEPSLPRPSSPRPPLTAL